ncbi:MAG: hypothetical protein EBS84_08325 [Proteobacteria bacterium]|nr:hypothetical protein [Pseudomonadota bacterium]
MITFFMARFFSTCARRVSDAWRRGNSWVKCGRHALPHAGYTVPGRDCFSSSVTRVTTSRGLKGLGRAFIALTIEPQREAVVARSSPDRRVSVTTRTIISMALVQSRLAETLSTRRADNTEHQRDTDPNMNTESILKTRAVKARLKSTLLAALAGSLLLSPTASIAAPMFLGYAAGDATSTDVTLWTRAVDTSAPAAIQLFAQLTTDQTFNTGVFNFLVTTVATNDYTVKVQVTQLQPSTRYYYRFTDGVNTTGIGTFKTAPAPNAAAPVRFAFSGDNDGLTLATRCMRMPVH